jgi:hypothetical protein
MADRRIIRETRGYWLPKTRQWKSLKPSILDFPDPPPRPAGPKTTLKRIADALETIARAINGPEPDKQAPKEDINNE